MYDVRARDQKATRKQADARPTYKVRDSESMCAGGALVALRRTPLYAVTAVKAMLRIVCNDLADSQFGACSRPDVCAALSIAALVEQNDKPASSAPKKGATVVSADFKSGPRRGFVVHVVNACEVCSHFQRPQRAAPTPRICSITGWLTGSCGFNLLFATIM